MLFCIVISFGRAYLNAKKRKRKKEVATSFGNVEEHNLFLMMSRVTRWNGYIVADYFVKVALFVAPFLNIKFSLRKVALFVAIPKYVLKLHKNG